MIWNILNIKSIDIAHRLNGVDCLMQIMKDPTFDILLKTIKMFKQMDNRTPGQQVWKILKAKQRMPYIKYWIELLILLI